VDGFRSRMQDMWEVEEEKDIEKKLEEAIDAATEVCSEKPSASDCAIAWETAEELSDAQMRRQWRREDKNAMATRDVEAEDVEPTAESLDKLLEQTPDVPQQTQGTPSSSPPPPSAPKGKELPRTGVVREIMESEVPCAKDECEPATGSFFKAAELEKAFGGGTVEHFEQMMIDTNNKLNKKDKKVADEEDQQA